MSTYYLIMVPRAVRCEACDGRGTVAPPGIFAGVVDAMECEACGGSGVTGDTSTEPNREELYSTPGKARGVFKRTWRMLGRGPAVEGRDFEIREIDLDLCESITKTWPVERQASHAIERAIFWTRRAVELGKRAHLPIADTAAGDALQVAQDAILAGRLDEAKEILAGARPEEPALSADDMATIRHALDALVRLGGGDRSGAGLIAAVHLSDDRIASARAVLGRLDAHAALSDLHRQRVQGSAATVEAMAQWASGGGPRRCARDESRDAGRSGMAWTRCGDLVPIGATTINPGEVACSGCSRATGDPSADLC